MLCFEHVRQELTAALGPGTEQRLQRALLGACCTILGDPAAAVADAAAAFPANPAAGAPGSQSPPRPSGSGPAVVSVAAVVSAQDAVIRLVLTAVPYGHLLLPDAVALLCQPDGGGQQLGRGVAAASPPPPWDVLACRRALLGPPAAEPGPAGSGTYCFGEAALRHRIQCGLPSDLAWSCVGDLLTRGVLGLGEGDGAASAASATVATVQEAAAALASHAPLRHVLLSDPRAVHERLCSPPAMASAAALLAAAVPSAATIGGVSSSSELATAPSGGVPFGAAAAASDASAAAALPLRLPQRLVVASLAAGALAALPCVTAHEAAAGLDADTLLGAVLAGLEACCFGSGWLLLRLLVDEAALLAACRAAERRGLREAMEAAVSPALGQDAAGGLGKPLKVQHVWNISTPSPCNVCCALRYKMHGRRIPTGQVVLSKTFDLGLVPSQAAMGESAGRPLLGPQAGRRRPLAAAAAAAAAWRCGPLTAAWWTRCWWPCWRSRTGRSCTQRWHGRWEWGQAEGAWNNTFTWACHCVPPGRRAVWQQAPRSASAAGMQRRGCVGVDRGATHVLTVLQFACAVTQMGRGVGDHLLKSTDWLLQVRAWCAWRQSLVEAASLRCWCNIQACASLYSHA